MATTGNDSLPFGLPQLPVSIDLLLRNLKRALYNIVHA
jgi:hypothetical protein